MRNLTELSSSITGGAQYLTPIVNYLGRFAVADAGRADVDCITVSRGGGARDDRLAYSGQRL